MHRPDQRFSECEAGLQTVITLVLNRRSHVIACVCDLAKEIVTDTAVFGNFTVFATFPESETNKCLWTDFFMYLCSLKLCQTAIFDCLSSIIECLWDQIT